MKAMDGYMHIVWKMINRCVVYLGVLSGGNPPREINEKKKIEWKPLYKNVCETTAILLQNTISHCVAHT